MAITIWNELADLERRMDEFFEELSWPRAFVPAPKAPKSRFLPAADVFHKNGDLVIRADLAGMDPVKDVKLTLLDGDLVITGERRQETEVREEDYFRRERSYGSFERHIAVPEGTDAAKVKASYHDGILEVTVAGGGKPAAAIEGKPIEIKVKPAK